MEGIEFCDRRELPLKEVLALYRANGWSAAEKPEALLRGLAGSDCVYIACDGERLVGLGNALSDGYLVVYYPHLLVLPEYRGRGIGRRLVGLLQARYDGLHQQVLVADGDAVGFYEKCGFELAGRTRSMWIYAGGDH